MANWTKNEPTGVTTRRKWKLEDRASLNKLKHHIAEEGCPEVQYDLARQLLDETIDQNMDASNQQAVHWLISAAQQGHEDAAKLLRKCHENGSGITSENEAEVLCCLSMSPGERAARKAARELFACLSNGSEHITPKQLERRMRRIYNLQRKRRRRHDDSPTTTDDDETESDSDHKPLEQVAASDNINLRFRHGEGERRAGRRRYITEANLVSAASNYAAGQMPAVNAALTLSVPHPQSLDHVPCFHRMIFHPVIFFTLLYHRLISFICQMPAALPISARFMLLILAYCFFMTDRSTNLLPIYCYYSSLGVMLWSTCKMLKTKQEFIDFRVWSGLFLRYGDHNIEADISENRFLRNNLKPYLYYFCALVCNLIVFPLVDEEWLPHSELTIVSGVCVFVSMLAFMFASTNGPDWIVLISFAVNVLAKYPYEMDSVVSTGWRFLDLRVPTFFSFVIGNGIEFCLNCRTALYLLIPVLLIHLAKRSNWHGVYTHLIPHCVTLSWLQLCITTSQSATMFGVMRATLGLAGLVLFLPLFGIVSLLIPAFVAIDWMGFSNLHARIGGTAISFGLAVVLSCLLAINRKTQKYITIIQIFVGIIAACILVFPYMTSNFKDSRFDAITKAYGRSTILPTDNNAADQLSWERYAALCGQQVNENNKIKTQLRCSHLLGMPVLWEGTVTYVQIVRVYNKRDELITKYLPRWLGNMMRCVCGDFINDQINCESHNDSKCLEWQHLIKSIEKETGSCTLHRWNKYEYEIQVKISSRSKSIDVVLLASHEFGNFTQRIANGDRVQFFGTLLNTHLLPNDKRVNFVLGSGQPANVLVKAIQCVFCKDTDIKPLSIDRSVKSPVDARMQDLMRGIKFLLNVLLNPLITFK